MTRRKPDPETVVINAASRALRDGVRPRQVVDALAVYAGLGLSDRYTSGYDAGYEAATTGVESQAPGARAPSGRVWRR